MSSKDRRQDQDLSDLAATIRAQHLTLQALSITVGTEGDIDRKIDGLAVGMGQVVALLEGLTDGR